MLEFRPMIITFILLVLLVAIITLFVLDYDLLAVATLLVLVGFIFYWYRLVKEEVLIHLLKINSGQLEYDHIINQFGRQGAKKVLARLEKKQLIQRDGSVVKLLRPDYPNIFDKKNGAGLHT
jgi:hypothetical protein